MSSHENRVVRAAPATAVIFSILFLPILFAGILCIVRTGQPWTGLLFCALYTVAIYAICSPTVFLTNGTLRYRNIFGSRSIELSSVTKVSITASPAPTLQLFATNVDQPFSLIIKPFTKAGVTCMMQSIRASSPNACFDRINEDLLRADFSSVTRETISTRNIIRIALTVGGASVAAALARALTHYV